MMVDVRMKCAISCVALAIAAGGPAAADHKHGHGDHEHSADDVKQEHRAHDVHVHGAWELFAALDDAQLSVTVKGPLVDIVGFERPPADDGERAVIQEMRDQFAAPASLFEVSKRSGCALSAPVQIILPAEYGGVTPAAEKDDAHDHEAHHDDHDSHHGDDHDDHAHGPDVEAVFTFDCKTPSRLDAITVTGFDAFPGIETVEAVFLGDAKQSADRLSRNAKTLNVD